MCVTHGMPCVNMHVTFEAYIYGVPIQFVEQQGEGGGREKRRGGKEKRKGGNEKRKGGKEKKREEEKRRRKEEKKNEEERKKKEEKEGVLRSEQTWTAKKPGTALQEVGFLLLWLFYA